MSTSRPASARRPARPRSSAPAPPRRPTRAAVRRAEVTRRRRRLLGWLLGAVVVFGIGLAVSPLFHHAVREITLPLKHEDIIRQQARDKGLDPALIAAVIYAESRFRDGQVSQAGAQGLMQLTPATARYIAQKSGGLTFQVDDLGTPQVNISYGAYYLRYLLGRYGGNSTLALAAYNGGEGNVDRWIVAARRGDRGFRVKDIPFPETRAYVQQVESIQHDYRTSYRAELGL
ncbi:MAG: soluble lytic murein transglycosylase [Solirubrobacteraceae bacterium]|nr:soluble lytic murein transglycosylase [Solirubrobacteraceae bacterium]